MAFNNYSITASDTAYGNIITGTFTVDPSTNLIQTFTVGGVNVLSPTGITVPNTIVFANVNLTTYPFTITYSPGPIPGMGNIDGDQLFFPAGPYLDSNGVLITNVSNTAIQIDAGPSNVFGLAYNVQSGFYVLSYFSIYTGQEVIINDIVLTVTPLFPVCFKDGSKILCLTNGVETYTPIEKIRKGTLVKTLKNGFVPVNMIGTSSIMNPSHDLRIKERMYKLSTSKYPELLEDLYITGCHSILVNKLSLDQRTNLTKTFGQLYTTDDKYRLMACVDDKTEILTEPGCYNIWHLALDSDSYFDNYAIYANGLLVESCSKRQLGEVSGMTIV
jgi:hypothetical protein